MTNSIPWPPQCCVPAFVFAAIKQFGIEPPHRKLIAESLSVGVLESDENPWNLHVVTSYIDAGVKPSHAMRCINKLLREYANELRFIHIPFSTIAYGLYDEVIAQSLERSVVVGIGLDWSALSKVGTGGAKHVARVTQMTKKGLQLVDDSSDSSASSLFASWDTVNWSTREPLDGLWLIGPLDLLTFSSTNPIRAEDLA